MYACMMLVICMIMVDGAMSLAMTAEEFQRLIKLIDEDCKTDPSKRLHDSGNVKKCSVKTEFSWACWPETKAGANVTIDCPWTFFSSGQLSRRCSQNGTWESIGLKTCVRVSAEELSRRREHTLLQYDLRTEQQLAAEKALARRILIRNKMLEILRYIDTVATFLALCCLIVFVGFQHVHFNLHFNLILAFFLSGIFGSAILRQENSTSVCNGLFVCMEYFFLVQVCWMFNEGLYRVITLYRTFSHNISIWPFVVFAWSFPALVVFGAYFPVMKVFPPPTDALNICWASYQSYKMTYIVWGTAFVFLAANCFFIVSILYVVMSKVRATKSPESTVALRGFRGFALLFILLGGGYMVTLYGPDEEWYKWMRRIVQPTQGLLVSIAHVAWSKEVWKGVRRRFRRLRNSTSYGLSIRSQSRSTRAMSNSNSQMEAWKAKRPSDDAVMHIQASVAPVRSNSPDSRRCSALTDVFSDDIRRDSDISSCLDILKTSTATSVEQKCNLASLHEETEKGSHINDGFCDNE